MSKRSRKDRRKAREQRAAASGDASSLRPVSERSPETAAAMLLQGLQAHQAGELPEELAALVASTSERLRASGKFDRALKLAGAARRASYAVRLEEALAAFGCGEDGIVRELAAADPMLARPLAPLLAVLDRKAVPNAPAGAGELTRGVHSLCRAVLACESGKAGSALVTLRAVPSTSASKLHIPEWKAAALLCDGRAAPVHLARTLLKDSLVRNTPSIEQALAAALATADPSCFLNRGAAKLGFSKEALTKGSVLALRNHGDLRGDQALVVSLVMAAGADSFAPAHRGAAALYEGFAFATSDPPRALAAFDKAVAQGADLAEALRGRLLAGHRAYHQSEGGDRAALKSAISATQRLIHLLGQRRDAAPFRALLLADLADLYGETQQSAYTLDAVRQCRALLAEGLDAPSVSARITVAQAHALMATPQQALEVVEQGLKDHPREEELHSLHAQVLDRLGRKAEADDAVLRAAELFNDPGLQAEARAIRRERGLPLVEPGKAKAGAIAAELAWRVEQAADAGRAVNVLALVQAPDLVAARAALEPDARAACDAATLGIIASHFDAPDAARVAVHLLGTPGLTREHKQMVLAGAIYHLVPDSLDAFAQGLVKAGMTGELLADAARLVASTWESRFARAFLARIAAHLKTSELRELQGQAGQRRTPDGLARVLLSKAVKHLAPDFDLETCSGPEDDDDEVDEPDDEDGDFSFDPGSPSSRDLIEGACEVLHQGGASEARIRKIPPAILRLIGAAVRDLATGRATDRKYDALVRALQLAGLQPQDLPNMFPEEPRARGRRRR